MKRSRRKATGWFFLAVFLQSVRLYGASPEPPASESVMQVTDKVARWQIKTFDEAYRYRAVTRAGSYPRPYSTLVWQNAVLYTGMDQWRRVSADPEPYLKWLKKIGRNNYWEFGWKNPYSSDDHAVGLLYLRLYDEFGDDDMIKPMRRRFNSIMKAPNTGSLERGTEDDWMKRWGWCDALFMAPPVWAGMARVTGEKAYLDFLDREYHAAYDLLWDPEENLFWRDSSFFRQRELNGKKLFWARGNGWVIAGLALMIPELPEQWEGREFYITLYRRLAARLIQCQRTDGTWSMGLLGDETAYPERETSGTGLITFGLAWGINYGLLDKATYEPAVFAAWNALTECVREDGLLGYVQPVGAEPGNSFADKSEVYGVGAFLAAGSEVYKLVGGK